MPQSSSQVVGQTKLASIQTKLYEVPANTSFRPEAITLTNTTSIPRTASFNMVLPLGAVSSDTLIVAKVSVPPDGQISVPWIILHSMKAGSSIWGAADVGATVNVWISGTLSS
jgi:hypothetical protein